MTALHFELPRDLEAAEPPAVRDEVRLMIARRGARLVRRRELEGRHAHARASSSSPAL